MIEYSDKKESADILGQLMNGASYMIPFVVVGGLLVSLSLSFGATTSPDGEVVFLGIWDKVHQIGALAFTFNVSDPGGLYCIFYRRKSSTCPGDDRSNGCNE